MKNIKKIIIFNILLIIALILLPNFCNAETKTIDNETDLINAINEAENGDIIELSKDIILTKPLGITNKTLTIDGKGFTISREDTNWTPDGDNSTLITAGLPGTKLTLVNLKLTNSEKYGVQAYDGAYVILDGVTISNCGFGGVLVNAGTVEVRNLTLNKNGSDSNNGIEIAKGKGVYSENSNPKLIMNGTLSSTEDDNVIFIAINDNLTKFEVENTESSPNKIFVDDNKVVVTDSNDKVLFESNKVENISISGDNYEEEKKPEDVTITVNLMEKTTTITKLKDSTVTKEELEANINLESLELSNYTIEGFYSDNQYEKEFDFSTPITEDITIYAKLSLITTPDDNNDNQTQPTENNKEKDDTPKTGNENYFSISILGILVSIISIAIISKKF